ncbi:MAG TPA: hypothetical protein VEZ40_08925, partial [Pyrinomonadaceae bacterium]|nr:hypothetical protein [Pyrinomonadaceae bacterium]
MCNRTINAFIIAVTLTIGVSTFWTATTTEHDGDDAAVLVAAEGSPTGAAEDTAAAAAGETPKKKGNRFARFFKAPFKAAAKLFGGDDDKVRRLSEKDVAKFESAPLMRVEDSRTTRAEHTTDEGGTAKDYLARGRARLDEGRLNEAVKELSRAVSLDS